MFNFEPHRDVVARRADGFRLAIAIILLNRRHDPITFLSLTAHTVASSVSRLFLFHDPVVILERDIDTRKDETNQRLIIISFDKYYRMAALITKERDKHR